MGRVGHPTAFEEAWSAHRTYLVDLAFRMLGDVGAAEDVVQEAFARLLQSRSDEIADARGWLIVVTSRLCLDQIKSARSRREQATDVEGLDLPGVRLDVDPADRISLDESVRLALVVVLEELSPAERVAFVLHDVFQVPFDVIGETLGRSAASSRQLAHRARQKVGTTEYTASDTVDPERQVVLERFIAACATGDLGEVIRVLDPTVSGTIDMFEARVVVGADEVGRNLVRFWGQPTTTLVSQQIGGRSAILAFTDRALAGVLLLDIAGERVTKVHVLVDRSKLDLVRSQLG